VERFGVDEELLLASFERASERVKIVSSFV
jgi:hypothetical protein